MKNLFLLSLLIILLSIISIIQLKQYRQYGIENFYPKSSRLPVTIAAYGQRYPSRNILLSGEKPVDDFNLEQIQFVESTPKLLTTLID